MYSKEEIFHIHLLKKPAEAGLFVVKLFIKYQVYDHGYGLYITKRAVQCNNGKIAITSTKEETEFLVKFKVKKLQEEKFVEKFIF